MLRRTLLLCRSFSTSSPSLFQDAPARILNALTDDIPMPECVQKYGYAPHPNGAIFCTIPESPAVGEQSTECYIFPKLLESLAQRPGFPEPPLRPTRGPSVALRECGAGDRGVGLFATRPIDQGEVLFDERPLTVTPKHIPNIVPGFADDAAKARVFVQAEVDAVTVLLGRMASERRRMFLALKNSHRRDGNHAVTGTMNTNSTGTELGDEKYRILCQQYARFNHSCSPNSAAGFFENTWSMRSFALRNVAKDEELTVAYAHPLLPTAVRQRALADWGFYCDCQACTDPGSDERRAVIAHLDKERAKLSKQFRERPAQRQRRAQKLLKVTLPEVHLIESEGLQMLPEYCAALLDLAAAFKEVGDSQRAREMAMRVTQCSWLDVDDPSIRKTMLNYALGAA
ncbi:SET domain-containing protein [Mycena kentingensis (nom. inval.)]|nr:SET domain-containing protein [Mycena kentingensis (nom. inval.)]